MIRAAIGGGADGVRVEMGFLAKDLHKAMIMTSCNSISDINERIFA
jgi:isopentenyl diphosphate isomerase/L-lactate dehydrogenase-like FMN-dependent dehydrogenase